MALAYGLAETWHSFNPASDLLRISNHQKYAGFKKQKNHFKQKFWVVVSTIFYFHALLLGEMIQFDLRIPRV